MIGLGVDLVDIERFALAVERTPRFVQRVFTDAELADVAGKADARSSLAARFAAREATMKALGVGLGAFDLRDVSIRREAGGRPVLAVEGRAAELAASRGIRSWHVSLSHTARSAVAVVAAE